MVVADCGPEDMTDHFMLRRRYRGLRFLYMVNYKGGTTCDGAGVICPWHDQTQLF